MRFRRILIPLVVAQAGIVVMSSLPVRDDRIWIDPVSGSMKYQTSWLFLGLARRVERSAIERWIVTHEGPYRPGSRSSRIRGRSSAGRSGLGARPRRNLSLESERIQRELHPGLLRWGGRGVRAGHEDGDRNRERAGRRCGVPSGLGGGPAGWHGLVTPGESGSPSPRVPMISDLDAVRPVGRGMFAALPFAPVSFAFDSMTTGGERVEEADQPPRGRGRGDGRGPGRGLSRPADGCPARRCWSGPMPPRSATGRWR